MKPARTGFWILVILALAATSTLGVIDRAMNLPVLGWVSGLGTDFGSDSAIRTRVADWLTNSPLHAGIVGAVILGALAGMAIFLRQPRKSARANTR